MQALHLQNNFIRYISPTSFYRTNSIVYLNLSFNNFDNLDHMGLRSVRNLEVLDLSGNKVRRISTNPLRNLDWLVELKMDDNQICKVQGEPFSSMPRLKVLTMRNNRMISVTEPTFRNLRGNLAVFDLDGMFHFLLEQQNTYNLEKKSDFSTSSWVTFLNNRGFELPNSFVIDYFSYL